ncbi:NUDIX hydrolase [Solirhodobacter olei]|uniref:NUDIX hydrolase n=1 Tax=Solirhodobacter olei TaxID=2493082 RepID=UPI000FD96FCF
MPIAEAVAADPVACQVAGLCWRLSSGGKLEVLLVTSRDTGRWILPKGWPIKGLDAANSALREAFEEAGVDGRVASAEIGRFPYVKVMGEDRGFPCEVAVFPIEVRRLRDVFPECDQRRRKWFPIEKAAQKVDEPELAELLLSFTPGRG